MKKIEKYILGFQIYPSLYSSNIKIERRDWYCNKINPLDKTKIPDHFDITIHEPTKKQITTSIYLDTSDSKMDKNGKPKLPTDIPLIPKNQVIELFNDEGFLSKSIKLNNGKEDNFTKYSYDEYGNLTLIEYCRLGYIQYKIEYEHDSIGNLVRLIHSKDDSHGKELFLINTESEYSYDYEKKTIRRDDYKYVDEKRIHRSVTIYEYQKENGITKIKQSMKHLRTQSESVLCRTYDKFLNQIENYSYQKDRIHSNSMKYKYSYDEKNNWIKRERTTMEDILTLVTERKIKYL